MGLPVVHRLGVPVWRWWCYECPKGHRWAALLAEIHGEPPFSSCPTCGPRSDRLIKPDVVLEFPEPEVQFVHVDAVFADPPQVCGHAQDDVVTSDEGTAFCSGCEREAREVHELADAERSRSSEPAKTGQKRSEPAKADQDRPTTAAASDRKKEIAAVQEWALQRPAGKWWAPADCTVTADRKRVSEALRRLLKAGRLQAKGSTSNRRYRVPPKPKAKPKTAANVLADMRQAFTNVWLDASTIVEYLADAGIQMSEAEAVREAERAGWRTSGHRAMWVRPLPPKPEPVKGRINQAYAAAPESIR